MLSYERRKNAMNNVTLQQFKNFKVNYVDKFFFDDLQWKARILFETINNAELQNEIIGFLEKTGESYSADDLNEVFTELRRKTVVYLEESKNTNSIEEKFDLMSLAMVYDGILESLDELSYFTDKLIDNIREKYGESFFTVIQSVDRANLSVDVKTIMNNGEETYSQNDPLLQKYLVLKDWQDRQHHFYLDEIEPVLWDLEAEYIKNNNEFGFEIRNPQLLRYLRFITSKSIIDIDELAKCSLIGIKEEIVKLYGGKAWGLAILRAQEEDIPLTNAISILEEDAVPLFVSKRYSVRSSADIEDGKKYSFAGMFDSFLNVDFESISGAIKAVKNSVTNERVNEYVKIHSLSNPNMGVIIQSYIEPELSGVWIGDSLETGYLEYVQGSGEKLVSGQITPSHEDWISVDANENYLTTALKEKVGEHMINLQKKLGCPADFEWCIINGKIVMLQFRPVTAKINVFKARNLNLVEESEKTFKGIAASPGVCCGEATYIRLIKEFDATTWKDRSILMAWFTDPEWMHILTRSSGVVTAVGGFLCHTAIIARELGIPCVIGIGQNMKKIWNEKIIRIDGTNGYVSVPEK